jgi:hypothetical protein
VGNQNGGDGSVYTFQEVVNELINSELTISANDITHDFTHFEIDGATVTIEGSHTFNTLTLRNNAKVITREINDSNSPILVINADSISIELGSVIDVNGKGYTTTDQGGPEAVVDTTYRSCHGGLHNTSAVDCSYGDYKDARFAGSAGTSLDSYTGAGGGVMRVITDTLELDGDLLANGEEGYNAGGAGGSIHVEAGVLTGAGLMSATGGTFSMYDESEYQSAGAGGRISLYVDDRSGFTGTMEAFSGIYDETTPVTAGTGTIFVKESAQTDGHLIVDNGGYMTNAGSTPIRSVGSHAIVSATLVSSADSVDIWQIEVGGTPWRATDVESAWGIQGIQVTLDADDLLADLYTVVSNTENTLTIKVDTTLGVDLRGIAGQTLLGVHHFESLTIEGGADVDFGGDRVIQP